MLTRLYSIVTSAVLMVALSTAASAQSPAGKWDLTVRADGSNYSADLMLFEQADTLAGTIGYPNGPSVSLQQVSLASDTLTFAFTTPEHGFMLAKMAVLADELTGSIASTYGDLPASARRKLEANVAVAGTWRITGDIMGNPIDETCTIEQDGATLGGSCDMGGTEYALTGEVKDGKITFEHSGGDYSGQALTLIFSGELTAPESLKGNVTVEPFAVSGPFSASPASANP